MKLCFCLICMLIAFFLAKPSQADERCMYLANPGPCSAKIKMFAHDPFEGDCKEFFYGGCGGNPNRFDTDAECHNACNVTDLRD
ncbi:hypothetical protein ACLKA7_011456 [Drosophila subpalustris]